MYMDAVFGIRTAYRHQLITILRQGILPKIRMLIMSTQRDVFRKIRICITAMERVPQLTLLQNVQIATTVVRQDPTHMIFKTKTHGLVLRVIAPSRTLQRIGVRQDPY